MGEWVSFVVNRLVRALQLVTELDYYLYFVTDLKEAELQPENTLEHQGVEFTVFHEERGGDIKKNNYEYGKVSHFSAARKNVTFLDKCL